MLILKKLTFWLALAGLVLAAQLVLSLRAGVTEPVPPPPVAPAAKPFARCLGAAGLVEARNENTLVGVPVPGLLAELLVKAWDRVEAGAPLLRLDDRELRALLTPQKAQVAVAEATLERLREQLARLEAVSDQRAVTAEELKLRRSDIRVAEAQVQAARASVGQTEALLERLTVRAPRSGTILQVNVRAGEYLSPSAPTPPLVLGSTEELQVRADIDEQLAPRVKQGARAVAYVKGDASRPITLNFVRIEPVIVPKRSLTASSIERVDTRVLQVILSFVNDPGRPVYVGQQMDLFIEEQP
jgi:HlyD family secretion protein